MRKCPFTGCNRRVPSRHFACKTHWHHLDTEEKALIYDSYRQFIDGYANLKKLRKIQGEVVKACKSRVAAEKDRRHFFQPSLDDFGE
jgi:hypothetical protein